MGYLSIIIALGALILVHELGHLLAALKLGIPVERFSLGFGPKLISRRWRGVEFRLSLIPFGGYVLPKVKELDDFYSIPVGKRILFSLGGPAANFIIAYICLLAINIPLSDIRAGMFLAPLVQMIDMTAGMFISLGALFTHPMAMSGAVGMVTMGGEFVGGSVPRLLFFSAFLSINLGLFNLLPVPALDGGKILFAFLEKLSIRTRKLQLPVTVISVLFLIVLMGFTTVMDVVRILSDLSSPF
ncbi:MAG: site-2 protease family protein [Candidatus Thermoplasmatota archaeon]|nr:site-2 protease family protein [Candidatus Thermoplasmatota archaeon]